MNESTIQFLFKSFIIVALILILASIYMAVKDVKGWGWFLFSGVFVLLCISYTSGDEEEEKEEEE